MAKTIISALNDDQLTQERFVLKQDEEIVQKVESLIRDEDCKLRLNLPPQPFIGHPTAKIWILQYNPGYSYGIDDFDYRGVLLPEFEHKRKETVSRLCDRIQLICDQYEFKRDVGFYAMDDRFFTFKSGARSGNGMYLWYNRTFFPEDGLFSHIENQKEFADNNLFVMEYLPYHSRQFSHEFFPFLPSFKFWQQLMQYAFTHEKIVLCHGLSDCRSLKSCALQSVSGYQEAKTQGWIYTIQRSGNGRSRLMLKQELIAPVNGIATSRLTDFLDTLR